MDFCFGFSPIKRVRLQAFTGLHITPIRAWTRHLPPQACVYVWGARELPSRLADCGAHVVRVEDGFLRSVGLGAAFAPPVSWALDTRGLHHWGHTPSDLEVLLQSFGFSDEHRDAGRRLIGMVRQHRLSKYNLGSSAWTAPAALQAHQGRKLLVIGQVANDAALQGIRTPTRTNMDLLAQVRSMHPQAYIAYKRHPDVTAGLRAGGDDGVPQWADTVMEGVGLHDALPCFDEVHVLNSLSGFEALIAGKPVVCHAQPFYAGWGLTQDMQPCHRRTRQLALSELVYGALALYPTYINPDSGKPMGVFAAIDYLARLREQSGQGSALTGLWLGRLYGFLRRLRLA